MMKTDKWTVGRIRRYKGKGRIVSLTAYDYATARIVDEAGIQLIIVGDSLGMSVLGYDSTIPVTMDDMIHHASAVVRGVKRALVVADMPFLSYQVSIEQAVDNAGRLIKYAGADAVKIEGGAFRTHLVNALLNNGIPVMGHIGLTPQSVRAMGGYKIQGKTKDSAERLKEDAAALDEAGVFSVVLEGMPAELAGDITSMISVPTVGIGAGPGCDGQVLVVNDLLGMSGEFQPRFVKRYANVEEEMRRAFKEYRREVEEGEFPGKEHCY